MSGAQAYRTILKKEVHEAFDGNFQNTPTSETIVQESEVPIKLVKNARRSQEKPAAQADVQNDSDKKIINFPGLNGLSRVGGRDCSRDEAPAYQNKARDTPEMPLNITEISDRFVAAVANKEGINIPASEMPQLDIPISVRAPLARRISDALEHATVNREVSGFVATENIRRADSDKRQQHIDVLPLIPNEQESGRLSPSETTRIVERSGEAQMRPRVLEFITKLVDEARENPALCESRIDAAEKVMRAAVPVGRPRTLTEEQRGEIQRRRGEGEKVSLLAEAYGVDVKTIFRITREPPEKNVGPTVSRT